MILCLFAGQHLATQNVADSAEAQPMEYQVKAAFLLNFTKFVEWPAESSTAPFPICIVGEDPFGRVLDQIVEGETVNARRLVVHRTRRPPPGSCRVLYVSGSLREVRSLLAGVGPNVLTVGEGAGFLRQGGMIAFVIENRRVRFDVNQGAADKSALKISSRLLKVARTVEK